MQSVSEQGGAPVDLRNSRRKRAAQQNGSVDRLPPHAHEMEQGVLGCILLSPKECLNSCVEKLGSETREIFYDLRHQTIFDGLMEMHEKQEHIDVITLQQHLKDKHLLDQVGGINYLKDLPDCAPFASNIAYYFDIVREKFVLRRMISTCTDVIGRVYDHEGEVDQLLDKVERDILNIGNLRKAKKTASKIGTLIPGAITKIEEYHERQGMVTGIATGYPDFDKMTGGLQNKEMIVIAARPSMGKTSLAMNMAEYIGHELKLPVGIFSLEMSEDALALRMLTSRARVNLRNMREGFLSERDFPKLANAAGKLHKAPIYIDDTAGLSVIELRSRARRMMQEFGIKVFFIDYMQRMEATNDRGRRYEKRNQEVSEISNGIKNLANELGVPIVALSQLDRGVEKNKGGRPTLADLRESGSIEQDADLVALLYRDRKNQDDDDNPFEVECVPVKLDIAKQRNGPTGEISLVFLKAYTRFETAAKVSDNDLPS